jgi:ATP-binding cassette subfamily F protein 3
VSYVQLSDVALAFGDRDVLKAVDFSLDRKSRVALTGANGSGKTTLMKIAAGMILPDGGRVTIQKGCRISYLPQSGLNHSGSSLSEEADRAFDYFRGLLAEKHDLEERLGAVSEEDPETEKLLHRHHDIHEHLVSADYYNRKHRIEKVLFGLGFSAEELDRRTETFSGGWQMRIALAKILLEDPDIMLLDEPTNYLDLEARDWLEAYLNEYHGGVCLVSHDRYFLDSTVSEIAEIFHGNLNLYRGNYTHYERRRKEELEELAKRYAEQQEEIARTEEFISKFRYNASKAKQVQSRIKYLERLDRIEIPEHLKKMKIAFPPPPHSGEIALEVGDLSKSYGENTVLDGVGFTVRRGEKLAVTGVNGAGKTTLLRIFAGADRNYTGEVRLGKDVKIGYFAQDLSDRFGAKKSIIETFEEEAPTALIPKARDMLGAFLFRGDDVYKSTEVLSGGERSRLALLLLLLHPVNLLILDEPTNHLDLHSKDILLDALEGYSGTVIFVSHDRHFLEGLATEVLHLEERGHTLYPGDYRYFLWKRDRETDESDSKPEDTVTSSEASETGAGSSAAGYEEEKRRRGELRRLERREEELIEAIHAAEKELSKHHRELADPAVYSDPTEAARVKLCIEEAEAGIESLTEEWAEVEGQLRRYRREES